jgi:hypothetical protein
VNARARERKGERKGREREREREGKIDLNLIYVATLRGASPSSHPRVIKNVHYRRKPLRRGHLSPKAKRKKEKEKEKEKKKKK